MAAITGIVWKKTIPLGSAAAGGLLIEVWNVPTSTAGDTQTLALPHIGTVLAACGISYAAQGTTHSLDVTTLATVGSSKSTDVYIIGTE